MVPGILQHLGKMLTKYSRSWFQNRKSLVSGVTCQLGFAPCEYDTAWDTYKEVVVPA